MSLTSALNSVQSIFNTTGQQSSIVSTNIANVGNSDYVRREASVTTSLSGAQVVSISRAQETAACPVSANECQGQRPADAGNRPRKPEVAGGRQ